MRAILVLMLMPLLVAGCASSGVNLGISLPIGNHMGVGVGQRRHVGPTAADQACRAGDRALNARPRRWPW
jgi:hypothetical protein